MEVVSVQYSDMLAEEIVGLRTDKEKLEAVSACADKPERMTVGTTEKFPLRHYEIGECSV